MAEYKCKACGGALAFDSATQKLKCPFCDSVFELAEYETPVEEGPQNVGAQAAGFNPQAESSMNWDVEPGSEWTQGEADGMEVYICNSCGGEIVCESTTASSSCPYCDNPVVLQGKMSGMLKPDFIIPFKLDKKAAKEALKKHVNSKKLVPHLFKDENHIEEIKGVYIPFWLFDAQVEAQINYEGEITRRWEDSNYKYIEHNFYSIDRGGYVAFDNVPVDGSQKMADDLMESIEPFDVSEAVPFSTAYLAGYMADKYDVDAQSSIEAANARIRKSTEDTFRNTVEGFEMVMPKNTWINLQNGVAKYALYPVWLLNTKWQGNTYTFAMNGQTGKFVGDLPLDKSAYKKKFALLAGIFSVVGTVIAMAVDYLFI